MKFLNVPEKDGIGKAFSMIQLIIFLAVFVGILWVSYHFVHMLILRILIFLADYFVSSMFLYLVVRPFSERLENKARSHKS
ncbi:MAG: hypothetical protein MJ071_06425 [Oscillospiraceae bacterium]|nr:hypothetical protein [Oscillospiraceae bacterium]